MRRRLAENAASALPKPAAATGGSRRSDLYIGPAGAEWAAKGWVGAFRVEDSGQVWRFNIVPNDGEPGASTWGTDAAARKHGGGNLWTPLSFDEKKNLLYVPGGNPAPDIYDEARPGDNLYTNSLIALDAMTGRLAWYRQFTPHEVHDYDLTHVGPMFKTASVGSTRNVVANTGKDGILLWSLLPIGVRGSRRTRQRPTRRRNAPTAGTSAATRSSTRGQPISLTSRASASNKAPSTGSSEMGWWASCPGGRGRPISSGTWRTARASIVSSNPRNGSEAVALDTWEITGKSTVVSGECPGAKSNTSPPIMTCSPPCTTRPLICFADSEPVWRHCAALVYGDAQTCRHRCALLANA
ncbi:MAG: Pyrrolo-quinoline quinone [Gammaproteobacteria bacterium]|nr:Pyrrolo-quinoline quinone [Gammaproteobacteria bacterium]